MEQITVLSFNELSPKAREKAIEDRRTLLNGDWFEARFITEQFNEDLQSHYGYDDLKVAGWSLSYCQGDGVDFEGRISNWLEVGRRLLKGEALELLEALHREGGSVDLKVTRKGYYHHWNSMDVEVDVYHPEYVDNDVDAGITLLNEAIEEAVAEDMKRISREMEKSGYDQIAGMTSEEEALYTLTDQDRDTLFFENGKVYRL